VPRSRRAGDRHASSLTLGQARDVLGRSFREPDGL
jgi:hypothetical protein